MDTKPLLALAWFFAALIVVCLALMSIFNSIDRIVDNYSAAVCVQGELRATSLSGISYVLRDSNGKPLSCDAQ